ncbi:hypothetical protein [Burkholderia glumae]|uniref:hypothetical protein n=2 Tax=Burkholderia glumae TaxID=337 RepID=UPI00054AC826|nr:hypothetical protein [Burkholderia glumae]KHJ63270.1 hypothetical protein NCPPB3923_09080 [Burkholderia glumae]
MDYILATFFAVMAATVYSAFALFINARGRRPAYRIVMWGYILVLFAASVATVTLNLPIEYLIFGSLISAFLGVGTQMVVAVKLGHIQMSNPEYPSRIGEFNKRMGISDEYTNSWKQTYHGPNDPLRHW